jgi:adenylate cyclase
MNRPSHHTIELPSGAAWGLSSLPRRAQAIVDDGLRRSEWHIVFVQAFIVVFLGALFFISPPPADVVAGFRPVPYALAAMALALAGRIAILAMSLPMLKLFAYIGVVIDLAVIIGLIWSFHLQYGQPPALFLKAPTQLYLFVVIAWHGLAIDPLRVAFAGIAAALGWLFLTIYAVHDGGNAIITRDFVAYMTSARVLVGAEVDRMIALLLFSAVLCLGIASARAEMLKAALGETATGELARFFPAGLASRITSADERTEAGSAVQKQAAILMVDIRDFTGFAEKCGPEDVLKVLTALQSRAVDAVSRHGGAIDKFLGDGVLATFGCVHPLETPITAALEAAADFIASVAEWNGMRLAKGQQAVTVGAAVSSGNVLFGTVGFGDRLEFTVIGDPVNRAAKLEKYNKCVNSMLITDAETFAAAEREGFSARPIRRLYAQSIAGISGSVEVVVLRQ